MKLNQTEIGGVESKIYLIRGQKVMLDFDLAELYEVPTMRLNQQVRRNAYRFPEDFMFSLTNQEFSHLKSQIVISSSGWGGRRKPPLAFTEQGIAMLSSVLNSRRAIEVNIAIMRTFVQLKLVLISNHDLEKKIYALEEKYDGQFQVIFEAIREIVSEHSVPRKRIIGLEKQTKSEHSIRRIFESAGGPMLTLAPSSVSSAQDQSSLKAFYCAYSSLQFDS